MKNLHEIVLDFSLSNFGLILTNNSFKIIGFASNENDQENSTLEIIYKSNNQTAENRANIKYKLIIKKS